MTLEQICRDQLYRCFRLTPPASHATQGEGSANPQGFEESVRRYHRIRDEARARIGALDPAGGAGFLFGVLPALLQTLASVRDDPGAATDRLDATRRHISEFLTGYAEAYQPFSLHDIAFKVLEREWFRSVPITQPSLDLGVGNGYVSRYIFGDTMPTVGSDPMLTPIECPAYDGYPHAACVDATHIPFENDTFATVFMVHSIDHVRDRAEVLTEMHRVLRPGGMAVFSDLSEFAPGLMPMGAIFESLGLEDLAADPKRFFMDFVGESREFWPEARYRETLPAIGFEDARIRLFCSPRLARACWLWFETHLLMHHTDTHLTAMRSWRHRRLRRHFFDFATDFLAPFIARDAELCETEGRGFNLFITARKRGTPPADARAELDVASRWICPACRGRVETVGEFIRCGACGLDYPVIASVPLMLPAYARAYAEIRGVLARQPWRKRLPAIRHGLRRHPRLDAALGAARRIVTRAIRRPT